MLTPVNMSILVWIITVLQSNPSSGAGATCSDPDKLSLPLPPLEILLCVTLYHLEFDKK